MRPVVQAVTIYLPPPISINALHRAYVRPGASYATTIKSEKYRRWISQAGYEIELQKPGRIDGAYGIRISVPKKTRIDLGNAEKAISDLLQAHGIIANDRLCQRIEVYRGEQENTQVQLFSTNGN